MQTKIISKLEQQVMNIIWKVEKCSTRDIHFELNKEKKVAYTTTATILSRLFEKGLVKRKMTKSQYIYYPKVSKQSYSQNIISSFLKNTFDSFGDMAIVSFAESIEKLPEKKKSYLLKILEEHDKSK